MRALRIIGRGLSDTLEHLLPFTMASLAWWVCVFLIIPGPAATIALFRIADPRIASDLDRPGPRASLPVVAAFLGRAWVLALPVGLVLGVLAYNLAVIGQTGSTLAVLVPLWAVLILLGIVGGLSAFSLVALLDMPAGLALKQGFLLAAARLPITLPLAIMLWLLVAAGTLLVVPVVMFLPATVATTINRFVLAGYNIPIVDPLAPTDERLHEQQTGDSSTWLSRFR